MRRSNIVVVSNRLPVTYHAESREFRPSSGGLVSALKGVHWEGKIRWIGSLGGQSPPRGSKLRSDIFEYTAVDLPEDVYQSYYDGFCNGVLWPLFHYQTERVSYRVEDWQNYIKVNELFCKSILENTKESDLIWVHDYHFFLLPEMLKRHRPRCKIGFFLHIPFPSSEIYRQLPVRSELLESVLHSDLIGFHDYDYLRHFCSAVYKVMGISSSLLTIEKGDHRLDLGVFPVSVDTQGLAEKAYSPPTEVHITHMLSEREPGLKVILGVDRLDYSKGLDLKLKIFERLLEKYPELVGKVQLLKIVVPSRIGNEEYEKFKVQIEQKIGEINGKYSTTGYVPITYIFGSVDLPELLALYRTSDVLLVTSQRDGMNLVSLEYLAVQDGASPGAIVLSEFTGAASTLSHAYKINPWDYESAADTLQQALHLSVEDKRKAFTPMAKFLEKYTATSWATSFLKKLSSEKTYAKQTAALPLLRYWPKLKAGLGTSDLTLLLDYDGVLVPIMDRPEEALPTQDMLNLLSELQGQPGVKVIIISGRSAAFLEKAFGRERFVLASNHGAKNFDPLKGRWMSRGPSPKGEWYEKAKEIMTDFVVRTPGSFIEEKEYSIVWHERAAVKDFGVFQSRKLFEELESTLVNSPAIVTSGKRIIEAKARTANKGSFVRWMTDHKWIQPGETVLCMGDDLTDEDMFQELGEEQITVHIGEGPTRAKYLLSYQDQVAPLLEQLLKTRKN